jgi:heat-inducible transcriptional repressor
LRGVSLVEASSRIIKEINDFRRNEQELLDFIRAINNVFGNIEDDIYIEGATSAASSLEEFNDFNVFKSLIRFNKDKKKLIEIIDQDLNESGIRVKIGSETLYEDLKDLSIVTAAYNDGEKAIGLLGIIGPKRMEYDKMMSLVNSMSKVLNNFFKNKLT